jgi:hypothetical protein
MEIEDLDEIAKRIFERCMPAKEEIEESPEKTKFLRAFPSLEYSTVGHILYETINIALIAGAADIVINKIRHRKDELEKSKEKMKKAAFEVLKKKQQTFGKRCFFHLRRFVCDKNGEGVFKKKIIEK